MYQGYSCIKRRRGHNGTRPSQEKNDLFEMSVNFAEKLRHEDIECCATNEKATPGR